MPLPPDQTSDDIDDGSSTFAKSFVVVTAVGAWVLLGFILLNALLGGDSEGGASSAASLPAIFCFFGAGIMSFLGSVSSLFAAPQEKIEAKPWLRWCAFANYAALLLVFALPWIGYWIGPYL